jgi:hypothetical protein
MRGYNLLLNQEVKFEDFTILPIRKEDRYLIMKWRNEQIYHLRQNIPLTKEMQDKYFDTVIDRLFLENYPSQLLFSFLKEGECIGYGGLVHINWIDKNAEISFLMKTELEFKYFEKNWLIFLNLIENVGFKQLNLHKLFVYAFDLRPNLYMTLQKANYFLDARLKEQSYFIDKFVDVVIYAKINS